MLEAGGELQISASLFECERSTSLARADAQGEAGRVFELVDDLVTELLAEQFSGAAQRVTRVALTTTDSLPALKAYLLGEDAFRSGRFSESLASFEQAVELDGEFALAWYRMSVAAEWAMRQDLTEVAAQRAHALADRLSDHDRRLLEARLANRRGDALQAERLYHALVAMYPEDVEAWTQLGEVRFHYGPMRGVPLSDSSEAYERVLGFEPDQVEAMWHLARIAATEGDHARVDDLVDRILALNPSGERGLEMEAMRAFARDDPAGQARVLERLAEAGDELVVLACWNVATYGMSLEGARSVITLNTAPGRVADARAVAHVMLAYLELGEGRWNAALAQLDQARRLRPAWTLEHRALFSVLPFSLDGEDERTRFRAELLAWTPETERPSSLPTTFFSVHDSIHPALRLSLLGLIEATLGLPEAAERAAALEALQPLQAGPSLTVDQATEVRARIAAEAGDAARALGELEQLRHEVLYQFGIASPFTAQSYGRFAHAHALAGAGRVDEALRLFASFDHVSIYDMAFQAPAALERARLLEARDDPGDAEAAQRLRAFFERRWSSADENLLRVLTADAVPR